MSAIRLGIVGCGRITEDAHVPVEVVTAVYTSAQEGTSVEIEGRSR